ncbi:MAG: MarR family transcriptional regulator [Lachnospiraceae bacterium]|nr:MarR family transcriptional regulator [Lachnospiraceae bacterium]
MTQRFELFYTTINQIHRNLQRIKLKEMENFGLKGIHVMCLFELNHNPEGLTLTQLSSLCGEDKAAISRAISELTKRKLVTSDAEKKYRAPITLTKDGQYLADEIDKKAEAAVIAGSGNLTPDQRNALYKMLTYISDNLDNYLTDEKETE